MDERVRSAEEEAEGMAGRLSEIAATAALTQLTALIDRYAEALASLEKEEAAWLSAAKQRVHSSSD
jgi:hypothetical protein